MFESEGRFLIRDHTSNGLVNAILGEPGRSYTLGDRAGEFALACGGGEFALARGGEFALTRDGGQFVMENSLAWSREWVYLRLIRSSS